MAFREKLWRNMKLLLAK